MRRADGIEPDVGSFFFEAFVVTNPVVEKIPLPLDMMFFGQVVFSRPGLPPSIDSVFGKTYHGMQWSGHEQKQMDIPPQFTVIMFGRRKDGL